MNIKYNNPELDFAEVNFGDKRLDKRLCETVKAKTKSIQDSILSSTGSRHSAKAFYLLLSNKKHSNEKALESAYKATSKRIKASKINSVLLPQDTTDINLNGHKKTENLGFCSEHIRGIKLHTGLALTTDGVPLGILSQKYSTRKEAKSELSTTEKMKRPIEEKESFKWLETTREMLTYVPDEVEPIILCDREGDFYELYCEMMSVKSSFVVRLVRNRKTTDGEHSIAQLKRTKTCGEAEIVIPRDTRSGKKKRTIKAEVAYCKVNVTRPQYASSDLPNSLVFNLVRITEINLSSDEPIEWFLATNLPLDNSEDAMEIVKFYVQRWKIERFHYVLKSGCQAEKIQQRTYERINAVLLIYSVIAVFILALTYLARTVPDLPCNVFFDDDEWRILYRLIHKTKKAPRNPYSLKEAVAYLGELGGYKRSPSDGVCGVKVIWKGVVKLYDAIDVHNRLIGQV
jgi:hypothetical protein